MSLLISQVVDHATNTGARYVELFNTSQFALDLTGYRLLRFSDGATTPSATMTLSGVVLPGGTFVITAAGAAFSATFGVAASTSSGAINGDGDDVYQLVQMVGGNPVVLDTFGVVGEVPAPGSSWNYQDAVATRVFSVGAPNATWTASEWTITPGTAAANPFTHAFDLNSAPTFSIGDGKVVTPVGASDDIANSVTVQPDGKILLGGYSYNGSKYDFALVRYNADGSLDTSFGGGDGIVTTAVGTSHDLGYSVAVQPDGKILLGGYSSRGGGVEFALTRYNTDGSLDAGFGVGGKVLTSMGNSYGIVGSVILQPDGKILLGGYGSNGLNIDFALTRYDSDGSLDTTFGVGGKVLTPGTGDEYGYSTTIQPDGKILVGGALISGLNSSTYDFLLVRYTANGSLDANFGIGGKVVTPVGASYDGAVSVVVQPDGKILLGGYSDNASGLRDFALVRYNSNGTLDTSFGGGDGIVITQVGASNDAGLSVTVQPDGKILLGGYSDNASGLRDFALVRYNADGILDTSFGGGDGIVTTAVGASDDVGFSVTLQPDGRILLGGSSGGGSNIDFALVRYNADGSLDLSFDGVNTLNGAASFNEGSAAVVIDGSALVYDSELATAASGGNYGGASVTLQRQGAPDAADVFSGANGLSFGGEGSAVTLNGVSIGTVTTNGGGVLVITFAAGTTQAQVNDAMSRIAYANTSDLATNSNTPIQIAWTFSDGAAVNPQSTTGTTTVNLVGGSNSPPSGSNATLTAVEDTARTFAVADFGYSDADNDPLAAVRIDGVPADGALFLDANGNGIIDFGEGPIGNQALISLGSIAAGQLKYLAPLNANGAAYTSLTFSVFDGTAFDATPNTLTIDVNAVNDAPMIIISTAAYNGIEQTDIALSGTGISIADPDALGEIVSVRLSDVNGVTAIDAGSTGVSVQNLSNHITNLILTGTIAQINDLFAGNGGSSIIYRSRPDIDNPTSLTNFGIGIPNGTGQFTSQVLHINITPVNDAPSIGSRPAFNATEQTDLQLAGISQMVITDVDAGNATVAMTLRVDHGALTIDVGTTGVNSLGFDAVTGNYSFSGTIAQLNALITGQNGGSILYRSNSDAPPATAMLTVGVNDLGNTGTGGALGFERTVTINIAAVNDAPVLADPADIVVGEQVINAAPVLLAPTATFTDADGYAPGYGGSRLVVTMANFTAGEDVLWVRNEGTAAGQVSISSSVSGPGFAVLYGGAIVGFATYLDTGLTPSRGLQIYFNTLGAPVGAPTAQATPEIIQAVLNNLTYQNTSDTPRTTNTFTVTFDYSQIGNPIEPLEQTFTLQINAENDAPTVTVSDRTLTENFVNFGPIQLNIIGTIADGDGNWDGGSLRVAGGLAEDSLSIRDVFLGVLGVTVSGTWVYVSGSFVGTVTGGSNGDDLVVTFNGNATTAAVNAVADAIHVFNASDNPTATRTLTVTITDGDGATDVETAVLAITPQNDFVTVVRNDPAAVAEAADASAQTIAVTGSLGLADPDIGGTITPSVSAGAPEFLLNGQALPAGLDLSALLTGLSFDTQSFSTGTGVHTLSWSYESTADLDFLGADDSLTLTFRIHLTDTLSGAAAYAFGQPITVTITGTDDAPIAANHTWSIGSNSPFGVTAAEGLLAEGDPDRGDTAHLTKINGVEIIWTTANPNESRTIDLAGDGSTGLLTVYQNGRYVYDPAGAYDPLTIGTAADPAPSFEFTLADSDGTESVGTITFGVNGVDDAPVVTFTPIVVAESSDPGTVLARIAFFDPEGADVSIAITDANGNVSASPFSLMQNVNGAWQLILDDPAAIDFEEASSGTGSIGLYLTLNDGTTGPQTHFVSVQVANVNEAPTLTDLVDVSAPTPAFMEEDATPVLIAGTGASVSDPDFIQDVTELDAAVTLTIARVGGADANDMLGLDFFESGLDSVYEVDGGDIWSLDDEDTIGTFEYVDGTLTITFNGGVPATPAIVSDILRSVTYAYNADFAIRQTVELAVTFNDQGYSFDSSSGDFVADPHEVTGIIAVDLVPINEAPAGADKIVSIGEDATYTLTVADFGYTDPNHDPFGGVYIEALPLSGDLFVDSNGNGAADAGETVTAAQTISGVDIAAGRLKYVSALHESGNPYSSFRFSVIDDLGASSLEARTITFNVNAVNDIPTIGGVATGAVVESGGVGNVTAGSPNTTGSLAIVDPDAGESTFRTPASLAGVYGAFTFNPATGAWWYQLDNARSTTEALRAGQMVHDLLTVTSFDGTATRTIDVTITGANDAPTVAAAISLGVTAAQPITITQAQLLSSAGDVDDGTVLQVNALSADSGTVDDHGDGTWLFTPTDGFVGPVTFSYFVHDSIATTTGSALLSVVDDSPAHTILWNTSADPATINGTTGFDTLRVVDGALPTSFDLVGHGFEAARYETGDTNGEPWATSVRSYDALWNLKQWYVTYDNGSAIRFGYDGAERLDWVQEYGASGVLERYTDYDQVPGSGNTWASFYNLYDPVSGMQTQKYVTYDDGSSLRQGYDKDGRIDWLQEYNAAGVLVRYTDYDQAPESGNGWSSFYNLYDGTSGLLAQRFFTYDDGTTLRQGYDSHGHLDWQEERRADSSLAYYTDWDQEDLETWASFVNVYDGTGAFVSRAYHLDI